MFDSDADVLATNVDELMFVVIQQNDDETTVMSE